LNVADGGRNTAAGARQLENAALSLKEVGQKLQLFVAGRSA
jgi:hypothetical protein